MICPCFGMRGLVVTTFVCLVALAGALILAFVGFPLIIDSQLSKELRLENGTEQWDRFVELPFAMNFKTFVFTVKNPDEILQGAKPVVERKGPYVYKQNRKKEIISVNEEEDTVTYTQTETFKFDEEASGSLKETDVVTVLNPAAYGILQGASNGLEKTAINFVWNYVFTDPSLFTTFTIKELFFSGYIFAEQKNCNKHFVDAACPIFRQIVMNKGVKNIEDGGDHLIFSYFNYKTRNDGVHTVKRGIDSLSELGNIIRWNNSTHLNFWGSPSSKNNETCSLVEGTDATIYAPKIDKDSVLDIFNTDICRKVHLKYFETETYKDIEGYRFVMDKNSLKSSTTKPEEDCYCTEQTPDINGQPNCYLDGVQDMKPCLKADMLFSFPHFLWADESYIKGIDGVDPPVQKDNEVFLLIEPNTGSPLRGAKRLQLNVALRPLEGFPITENLPSTYLPMIWVEEGFDLPDEYVNKLKDMYFDKVKLVDIVKYTLIGIAGVAVCISFGISVFRYNSRKRN